MMYNNNEYNSLLVHVLIQQHYYKNTIKRQSLMEDPFCWSNAFVLLYCEIFVPLFHLFY